MAVIALATLKTYFQTGDTPTESQFVDLIDTLAALPSIGGMGSPSPLSNAVLSASGETSLFVRYFGEDAPVLTKNGTADYTLTVPTGTVLQSAHWTVEPSDLAASTSVQLVIVSADNEYIYINQPAIINLDNTQMEDIYSLGITPTSEETGTGEVTHFFPNVDNFSTAGFKMVLGFA